MSGKIQTIVIGLAILLTAQALSLNTAATHEASPASISPTYFYPNASGIVNAPAPPSTTTTAPTATVSNASSASSITPNFVFPTGSSSTTAPASNPAPSTSAASISPNFVYPTGSASTASQTGTNVAPAATAAPASSSASIAPGFVYPTGIPNTSTSNVTAPSAPAAPVVPAPAPFKPTGFVNAIPFASCTNGTVQDPANGSCVCPASAPYTNASGWCVACSGNQTWNATNKTC